MNRLYRLFVLSVVIMLMAVLPISAQKSESTPEPTSEVETTSDATTYQIHDLEIDLGGFVTQAQLTYPLDKEGPFPTVILFHGTGPYDMDATYFTTLGSEPLSANFRLIAERLPEAGIAVLRFNKRGVNGLNDYDMEQVQQAMSLDQLVADATDVIEAAQELPQVNAEAIYLYGWSEGAWVAANAAQSHPQIAGIILQAPPDDTIQTILDDQWLEIGLPYLAETIDADGDGLLSLEEVATIPPGPVELMAAYFLYDQTSTPEVPVINSFVDQNDDGLIAIEEELRPTVELYLSNYEQFAPQVESSYQTGELIATAEKTTLILHGEQDGWVPVASAQATADAVPEFVMLNLYPGLGHALSETTVLAEDAFLPMDDAPIADMIAWIQEQQG
jgi:uncharacterized protein